MPRIGRSNRYDGGGLAYFAQYYGRCRQNLKPATRTATNAGMSDIEEAVRAILKARAELSAAQHRGANPRLRRAVPRRVPRIASPVPLSSCAKLAALMNGAKSAP